MNYKNFILKEQGINQIYNDSLAINDDMRYKNGTNYNCFIAKIVQFKVPWSKIKYINTIMNYNL